MDSIGLSELRRSCCGPPFAWFSGVSSSFFRASAIQANGTRTYTTAVLSPIGEFYICAALQQESAGRADGTQPTWISIRECCALKWRYYGPTVNTLPRVLPTDLL